MPAAEVEVTVDLVMGLLADQKPDLADLEVRPIGSGWDNFSFRVGEHLVARMPRREAALPLVAHETRWLPTLHRGSRCRFPPRSSSGSPAVVTRGRGLWSPGSRESR